MKEDQEQKINLVNREYLELTGVTEVINFSETEILLETNLGSLIITGQDLHVQQLDLDSSELIVDGYITEVKYDQEGKGSGFIKRLFK